MRRWALGAIALVAALGAVLVVSALRLPSRQIPVPPAPPRAVDAERVAQHLAGAVRFATVSTEDPAALPNEPFEQFHAWLAQTYPLLHRALALERVGTQSLLYTWRGSDPSLAPILLAAHQDVVPAENADRWTRPPFAGRVEDGFVWGRGSIDDKGPLVAICEAVEALLAEGFAPKRTVLLAFGQDEEVGGEHGAGEVAKLLASRGMRLEMVLDEGMAIVHDMLPGLEREAALVGVAEKGFATMELVALGAGGHSSTPPRETAAGVLARAITRLESHPLPGGIGGVARSFFDTLAPELPLYARVPLANLWLFGRPMDWALSRQPAVNALMRTTTAVTMLSGSPKDNVLAVQAVATVNFRLLPGDTGEQVRREVEAIVDDPRVTVKFKRPPSDASPVSPIDGPAFALLQRTIGEVFPNAIVAPGLTVGGTDCRHYEAVTNGLYRFIPFAFGPDDLKLMHGIDERLPVASLPDAVRFYARFVTNASGS
jgi:carboxypeptidase PM20D1